MIPDAILALIEAAVPDVAVYDSGVPTGDSSDPVPERYAVLWPDDGTRTLDPEDMKVATQSTGEAYTWQVSSVAPTRQMASWIAKRIRDAITDETPAVEGYSCGPIRHTLSATPDRNEQVLAKRSVLMADRYELLAEQLS